MDSAGLHELIKRLRTAGTDLQDIEVKAAVGKLPKSLGETLSAFANGSGGLLILGLSEEAGFSPAPGFNGAATFDALSALCSDALVPPVRSHIDILQFEGTDIVIAEVPEMPPVSKPCYVASRGMYCGSFVRSGDGDRRLTQYEIDRLVEERAQPRHDLQIAPHATLNDLDPELVAAVLRRQRDLHPRIFGKLSDADALEALHVAAKTPVGLDAITLAGLLCLGVYPQRFFPRLTVYFTCYPGVNKVDADGVKYSDAQTMAGPLPMVLHDTLAAVRRNMRVGGVLIDGLRQDVPDYPLDAVREAVCNALMHRDYSPMGQGAQVQVNMYADRLEVVSPGGLYGPVTVDRFAESGVSSTRNQILASLLETTPYEEGGYVAENRGTGFRLIEAELRKAGMEPPMVEDRASYFRLTMFRRRDGVSMADNGLRGGSTASDSRGPYGSFGHSGAAARRPMDLDVAWDADAVLAEFSSATQSTYRALESLGVARTSEVARAAGISRSSASAALGRLTDAGLVEALLRGSAAKSNPQRAYRVVRGRKAS